MTKSKFVMLAVLFILAFAAGLSGCAAKTENNPGKAHPPSEEEATSAFKKAEIAYSWFTGANQINIEPGGDKKEVNGNKYFLVAQDIAKTRAELYDYLCIYFPETLARELIDKKVMDGYLFEDFDDKLYVFGSFVHIYPYDMVETALDIQYISDEKILLSASIYWENYGLEHYYDYDYQYEKDGKGDWKFINFQLPSKLCVENAVVDDTREQIAADYIKAAEAYSWFDVESLPATNETGTHNGTVYNKVRDDAGFKSVSELETYLKTLFSDDIVSAQLYGSDPAPYADIDGELYVLEGGRGTSIWKIDEELSFLKVNDSKYVVTVTSLVNGNVDSGKMIGAVNYDFNYEYIDERWVFTSFGSTDDFDENSDGIYVFDYNEELIDDARTYDDLKLCYYVLGSGVDYPGGYELGVRLLDHPDDVIKTIAGLYRPWRVQLSYMLGANFARYFSDGDVARFKTLLTEYVTSFETRASVYINISRMYYSVTGEKLMLPDILAELDADDIGKIDFDKAEAEEMASLLNSASKQLVEHEKMSLPYWWVSVYVFVGKQGPFFSEDAIILSAGLERNVVKIRYMGETVYTDNPNLYSLVISVHDHDETIDEEELNRYGAIIQAYFDENIERMKETSPGAGYTGGEVTYFALCGQYDDITDGTVFAYRLGCAYTLEHPESAVWAGGTKLDSKGRISNGRDMYFIAVEQNGEVVHTEVLPYELGYTEDGVLKKADTRTAALIALDDWLNSR